MSTSPSPSPPPRERPSSWTVSSNDLNVLITGVLVEPWSDSDRKDVQIQLEHGIQQDVYIEHPALTQLSTTPTSQTLRSLNSNTAVFTLPLPLAPGAPIILTLHTVIPFSEAATVRASPFFSETFNVLLQGPGFPLPTFDPTPPPSSASTVQGKGGSPFMRALSPLGSRGRSNSLSATSDIPSLRLSKSRQRPSPSPTPHGLLAVLLGGRTLDDESAKEEIGKVAREVIGAKAREVAEAIQAKRREHELWVGRVKRELEVLEARIEASGRVIKGFLRSGSASRERAAASSSPSEKRDISRGRKGLEEEVDLSRQLRAEDEGEEEGRGRSGSRDGRRSKDEERKGRPIQATVDDEEIAAKEKNTFVPHSLGLIAIPEAEELELPGSAPLVASVNGAAGKELKQTPSPDEDEETTDPDGMFDMDEDLVQSEIPSPGPEPRPPVSPSPSAYQTTSLAPTQPMSMSFRPGSFRASTLSSSFKALLSAQPLPPTSTDIGSPDILSTSPGDAPHGTQVSARNDAFTAFLSNRSRPSPETAQTSATTLRQASALDAPSHRAPLPRKRQPRHSLAEEGDDEALDVFDAEDADVEENGKQSAFLVGSLPVAIGPFRGGGRLAGFAPPAERELQRKTSVPARREGMMVPALPKTEKKKKVTLSSSVANAAMPLVPKGSHAPIPVVPLDIHKEPIRPPPVASSLAQSLRHPPLSFARRIQEDDDVDTAETSDATHEGEESSEGFVPPHVWRSQAETDEELLSRSIFS